MPVNPRASTSAKIYAAQWLHAHWACVAVVVLGYSGGPAGELHPTSVRTKRPEQSTSTPSIPRRTSHGALRREMFRIEKSGPENTAPRHHFPLLTWASRHAKLPAPFRFTAWGCSSIGRALEWHSRGKGFDPPQLHHHADRRYFQDVHPSCASIFRCALGESTIRWCLLRVSRKWLSHLLLTSTSLGELFIGRLCLSPGFGFWVSGNGKLRELRSGSLKLGGRLLRDVS